jgi:hypothetical protein
MTTTATKPANDAPAAHKPARDEIEPHLSVRHTDALPRHRDCGLCGKKEVEPGWKVCHTVKPLCDTCERKYPALRAFARRLDKELPDPTLAQVAWALLPPAQGSGRVCPGCRGDTPATWAQPAHRGVVEVGQVPTTGFAGGEILHCPDCLAVRPETSALCRVVDEFYEKRGVERRALKPKPEPAKPPSAEELAARVKARRLVERAKSVGLALWPFGGTEQYTGHLEEHERDVTRRGLVVMRAVKAWLEEDNADADSPPAAGG